RRTRSSAAKSVWPRATPSTASRSAAARIASTRSAISRTSSRSSAPKGRLPIGSCSARTSRRSRPANCSCRRASPVWSGSSSRPISRRTISAVRARRCVPASIIPAIPSRSSWALPSLMSSIATSRWASTSSAATSTPSTSSAPIVTPPTA
ncbi:hypothetical protein LTR94_033244, partial [Friedmanniomyces endolithicus]